jgi:hypothetical protein
MVNIETEKLSLIKWLEGIENSEIINQLLLLKQATENTFPVTALEKEWIDKGIKAIEEGRIKTHEQVNELAAKKYPSLVK